jgi:hypothetical protein
MRRRINGVLRRVGLGGCGGGCGGGEGGGDGEGGEGFALSMEAKQVPWGSRVSVSTCAVSRRGATAAMLLLSQSFPTEHLQPAPPAPPKAVTLAGLHHLRLQVAWRMQTSQL